MNMNDNFIKQDNHKEKDKKDKSNDKKFDFVAFCTSGLEGAVAVELKKFNYKITYSSSGRIFFKANLDDIPFLNMTLKTVDRIALLVNEFEANTFDELYENVRKSDIKNIIEKNAKIKIEKIKITNSKLSATGAVASVVKKALIDNLSGSDESGPEYPFIIIIKDNRVYLLADTTGEDGLHKRGYRLKASKAPLRETIAAGIITLSRWELFKTNKTKDKDQVKTFKLIDPFCGSGTIPIEAFTLELPNFSRNYVSKRWKILNKLWKDVEAELEKKVKEKLKFRGLIDESLILGFDVDFKNIKISKENLMRAQKIFRLDYLNYLERVVEFKCLDFRNLPTFHEDFFIISNLPYGERLDDNMLKDIKILKEKFPGGKFYLLHPSEKFETYFGKAAKKFRFQNSGIWTYLYMYY